MNNLISFNRPYLTGKELARISDAATRGHLSGDGYFSKKCSTWLEHNLSTQRALLTHSCTAALEIAAILANITPGDEVIMPSYTFVSTANAFVLRGGVPVFVDIRLDTLNIDERLIESAITSKTKAIVPVHYAGVPCEMDRIMEIANKHNLIVIEDAAQAINSWYKGKQLGTIGDFGCLSFHETKNIQCGEGGALLVNSERYLRAAEIVREKGTDRSQFFRGEVDKYTWQSIGSSFLPSELNAAFLSAQLESIEAIQKSRLEIWQKYFESFSAILASLETQSKYMFKLPGETTNAHMFQIIFEDPDTLRNFREFMKKQGVQVVTHYVPLHSSPAGSRFGRTHGNLINTEYVAERLIRFPLYPDLVDKVDEVVEHARAFFNKKN